MNKYLVVVFDRRDTTKSTPTFVVAETPNKALMVLQHRRTDDKEALYDHQQYVNERLQEVSDTFSCIPEEEIDTLVYKIG